LLLSFLPPAITDAETFAKTRIYNKLFNLTPTSLRTPSSDSGRAKHRVMMVAKMAKIRNGSLQVSFVLLRVRRSPKDHRRFHFWIKQVHKTEYLLPLLHKATGENLEWEGIQTHASREGFQVRVCETRKHVEDDNSSRVFLRFYSLSRVGRRSACGTLCVTWVTSFPTLPCKGKQICSHSGMDMTLHDPTST
jgi:hypothetical protein